MEVFEIKFEYLLRIIEVKELLNVFEEDKNLRRKGDLEFEL